MASRWQRRTYDPDGRYTGLVCGRCAAPSTHDAKSCSACGNDGRGPKTIHLALDLDPVVWSTLPACPACPALAGKPCIHRAYTRNPQPLRVPHRERTAALLDWVEAEVYALLVDGVPESRDWRRVRSDSLRVLAARAAGP